MIFFCASACWSRTAPSSEDKESSFSLRAASAFRMATSFSSRALPFSSRVPESVATVALEFGLLVLELGLLLLERRPNTLQLGGPRLSLLSLLLRHGPLDVTLTGGSRQLFL